MDNISSAERKNFFIEECFNLSPSERNAFARCCGTPILKAPIDVLISFWGMRSNQFKTEQPAWSEDIEARFFIACLISKYGKDNKTNGFIQIPDELRKMYDFQKGQENCTRNVQIKTMLTTPLDHTAQLCFRIKNLIDLMPKQTQQNIDFDKLYKDIKYWNNSKFGNELTFKSNGSRYAWAYRIVKNPDFETQIEN